jgi:hypothetical protein
VAVYNITVTVDDKAMPDEIGYALRASALASSEALLVRGERMAVDDQIDLDDVAEHVACVGSATLNRSE